MYYQADIKGIKKIHVVSMRCSQCPNNAFYQVGPEQNVPLCLNCYVIFQQTLAISNQELKEQINYYSDQMDAMFGISRNTPRYPTRAPVVVSGGTIYNNHIAINNSQVGLINTGNIENLNQTIDSLYTASQKELADSVKNFSDVVLNEVTLTKDQKDEIFEGLDFITREVLELPERRKKTVVKTLMSSISSIAGFSANSLAIWQVLHPLLQKFF